MAFGGRLLPAFVSKRAHPMKIILLAWGFSLAGLHAARAQPKVDLADYFEWFQEKAQTESLYGHGARLYVFTPRAPLFRGPSLQAPVLRHLSTGEQVISLLAAHSAQLPSQSLRGIEELWYPVRYQTGKETWVKGYLWGGDLAKGWREEDLDRDGKQELLLLGLSPESNMEQNQVSAELKVLSYGKVIAVAPVPNLCIFEACGVTPLLRRVPVSHPQNMIIMETSVLHIGCQQGLNRAFFHWNGWDMERVYQGEWIEGKILHRRTFEHKVRHGDQVILYQCTFSREDDQHNPVWDCRQLKPAQKEEKASQTAQAKTRAR